MPEPGPSPDQDGRVTHHDGPAVRGTARMRLGDVNTGDEADFVLPKNMVIGGQVTVVLHPIGGPRDFSTGPIMVSPGQQIDMRVENAITQTNWSIN